MYQVLCLSITYDGKSGDNVTSAWTYGCYGGGVVGAQPQTTPLPSPKQ